MTTDNKIFAIFVFILGIFYFAFIIPCPDCNTSCKNNYGDDYLELNDTFIIRNITIYNVTNKYYDYSQNENTTIYERPINFNLRKTPRCFGAYEKMRLHGDSMQPYLANGESLYIDFVSFDKVTSHDVIAFYTDAENTTIHAVTYKNDNYALTAGYNNNYVDPDKVTSENYYGRVCERWK